MKKIIIANWKMNPVSVKEAEKLFRAVAKSFTGSKKVEVIVCAPYIYLERIRKISKKILLGGQDAFAGETGAFTGEISTDMLASMGMTHVIVGHSERRALGETNEMINKKIKGALSSGIIPVVCVGEKERDANHEYFGVVKNQVEECLHGIAKNSLHKIIIAYEPVWALSTTENRRDATPTDASEMAIFIRKVVADKFSMHTDMPRIIYGGSVSDKDVEDFVRNGGVEGFLVGRASLDPKKFNRIIQITENTYAVN